MTHDTVKVIVKVENQAGKRSILLFFPETQTNHGNIQAWAYVGEHWEASMTYFWSLKPPRKEDEALVTQTLAFYQRRYRCAGPFKLKRVMRDTDQMRKERWKR